MNLEHLFEGQETDEDHIILPYTFDSLTLQLKTRKQHIGVSRSVWKASIVMSNYLQSALLSNDYNLRLDQNTLKVLELGSGPGLGGIFASSLLSDSKVYMTDICPKSLQLIRQNIDLNSDKCKKDSISVNCLEWGKHSNPDLELNEDKTFPEQEAQFDLIIASDVVYIPECLNPMLCSIKHFMKKDTGRCLLVNNRVRQDLFIDRFDQMLVDNGLNVAKIEDIKYENDTFRVYILTH